MAFFDVSLETANRFYTWGWRGSIIGAVVTAIAVCFLMWGTRVRDHDAETKMTDANSAAALANERAAVLEKDAAALSKEAANARLGQEQIKAQLAWRTLKPEAIEALATELHAQKGVALFIHNGNDTEALYLAIQFSHAFAKANWAVWSEARSYADRVVIGISIPGPESAQTKLVRSAFTKMGIAFNTQDIPTAPISINALNGHADVTIFIGSKPPPF